MDIYAATTEYVSNTPITKSWPEFQSIFTHIATCRPKHWQLPVKSCLAVGGIDEQAIPAVAAIACAQIGIILLDDMLDHDPRGQHHRLGHGKAANLGATFQIASLEAILRTDTPVIKKLDVLHSTNQMLLSVAVGQDMDIQVPTDETAYWRVVENKSASFFGTALFLGALLGGASEKITNDVKRFGKLYGEMIQIHDDLNDAMTEPAGPDWIQRRAPLPILFAQIVDHPARKRFLELCANIAQPDTLEEAQQILIQCGAVSYCVDQLLHRHQAIQKILENAQLVNQQILNELANEIVNPVWNIFNVLGIQPVSPLPTRLD